MKIVINKCWGGFGVSEEFIEELGLEDRWSIERDDPRLIARIEAGENVSGPHSELVVVNIPDEATDWEIDDYDGMESIIYVVNGKLCHL